MIHPGRRSMRALLAIATLAPLVSCSSTELKSVWASDSFEGRGFRSFLVVGVAKEDVARRVFETDMVDQLRDVGVEAVASHTLIPSGDGKIDEEAIREAIAGRDFDAVLVARKTGKHRKTRQVGGGTTWYAVGPSYRGWYGHYENWYAVRDPGYEVEDILLDGEVKVFDVESEAMVWAGRSVSTNPDSLAELTDELGGLVIGDLRDRGFVD